MLLRQCYRQTVKTQARKKNYNTIGNFRFFFAFVVYYFSFFSGKSKQKKRKEKLSHAYFSSFCILVLDTSCCVDQSLWKHQSKQNTIGARQHDTDNHCKSTEGNKPSRRTLHKNDTLSNIESEMRYLLQFEMYRINFANMVFVESNCGSDTASSRTHKKLCVK